MEVKGYPSRYYRSAEKAGQTKPTNPSLQAQHWYAEALLKAIRLQTSHEGASAVIALPNFPRYRTLIQETQAVLTKLGIAIFLVDEAGGEKFTAVTQSEVTLIPNIRSQGPVRQ